MFVNRVFAVAFAMFSFALLAQTKAVPDTVDIQEASPVDTEFSSGTYFRYYYFVQQF